MVSSALSQKPAAILCSLSAADDAAFDGAAFDVFDAFNGAVFNVFNGAAFNGTQRATVQRLTEKHSTTARRSTTHSV